MVDPFFLAAGTFLFTVFGTAITTTWRVGRMLDQRDSAIIAKINMHEISDTQQFAQMGSRISLASENLRHEFGETGAALRQKMHEMEMWGRDNNVSKRSFEIVMGEIKDGIKALTGKLDTQILRDARVDRHRADDSD